MNTDNMYSCRHCGEPFVAGKPDDTYVHASRFPCKLADYISQNYKCSECGLITILYWHREKHLIMAYIVDEIKAGNKDWRDSLR